jgi:hypothetical protein
MKPPNTSSNSYPAFLLSGTRSLDIIHIATAQARGQTQNGRPFDWLSNQSCAPQVSLNISLCGCRLKSREQFAKNTELKGIPQFQDVQWREGERHSAMDQVRLSLRRIRVCDVARNQKTAVSVMAGLQKGFSSRSRRTKLGNTRSPKIRFARASTSGHVMRLVCFGRTERYSSSKARIATITFSRSRAGNAFTRLINSATLIPLP